MESRLTFLILIFILITLLTAGLFSFNSYAYDFESNDYDEKFDYAWTKALCEGNQCRDYLITCSKGEIAEMTPITGFVTFSDNWQDPRDEEFRNKFC